MKSKTLPLFWISGNYYDCQRSWDQIISNIDNPRVEILDCGYPNEHLVATAGTVIKSLKNKNIFDSSPHVIKLKGIPPPDETESAKKNGHFTTGYKLLISYLKRVNDKKILVIDGPIGYSSKPPKKRFNSVKTSKFFKEFKRIGNVIEHPMDAKDYSFAIKWFTDVCNSFGKKIDNDAAKRVVGEKGFHLDALYSVALLFKDYVSSSKIKMEDVEKACIPIFTKLVWDLTAAIENQDFNSSIGYLQEFYQSQETPSAFFGEVQSLLGALRYKFLTFVLLKGVCGENISYNQVKDTLADVKKKVGDEWKPVYTPGAIGQIVKSSGTARMLKLPESRLYRSLLDIDDVRLLCRTKFSNSSVGIKHCLDTMIMVLCGKLSLEGAAIMRGNIEPAEV